jgi:hypothetical protein
MVFVSLGLVFGYYSPDGLAIGVLMLTGDPKAGVPSAFQVNFWMRGLRLLPQPCPLWAFA